MTSSALLSDEEREKLASLADALIPASGTMPSAGVAGVPDKWVERVLAVRADLLPQLAAVLAPMPAAADAEAELKRLETRAPEALAVLQFVVVSAYYMSPKVRKALGYPGQKPKPLLPDEAAYFLDDALIAPVLARGPRYRSQPEPGDDRRQVSARLLGDA